METLFENHYRDSLKAVWERTRKSNVKVVWIISALLEAYLLWQFISYLPKYIIYRNLHYAGYEYSYILFYPILMVALGLWVVLFPYFRCKNYIRKEKAAYNGQMPVFVVQFGEQITCTLPNVTSTLKYEDLTRIKFLKNSIILTSKFRGVVPLDYDGFTKGTLEEFRVFLAEKCPNIKIPK